MVKHEEGMERMARAIKQSVDGSGYPSSALFPITGERGGGGEGAIRKTLSMRRTRIRTSGAERSGRFTFLAPSSRRRYMNALQPEKEKGRTSKMELQSTGKSITRKTWTVDVRINKL